MMTVLFPYLHVMKTQFIISQEKRTSWDGVDSSFCSYRFSHGKVVSSLYFASFTHFSWCSFHLLWCWAAMEIGAYLVEWIPVNFKAKFCNNFTRLNSILSADDRFDRQINICCRQNELYLLNLEGLCMYYTVKK